jgi:cytochrome c oxidase cbb3-type subunit 3
VKDIERTILYGVRSGHPKSRNITAMPGYGVMKMLPPDQINDVVAYTLSLSVPEAGGDPAVLARGKELFESAGGCFDCHNEDGSGNPDYGAPALNDADWTFGGDPASVKRSVYDGRRGRCPAFIDTLDFATIRGIALFIFRMSHPEPG